MTLSESDRADLEDAFVRCGGCDPLRRVAVLTDGEEVVATVPAADLVRPTLTLTGLERRDAESLALTLTE